MKPGVGGMRESERERERSIYDFNKREAVPCIDKSPDRRFTNRGRKWWKETKASRGCRDT
jgi:hypothetical protein